MKVFVKFVGSVFFVDLRLSQEPHIPTTSLCQGIVRDEI